MNNIYTVYIYILYIYISISSQMLKNAPSGIETCAPELLEMESSRVIITYQLYLKGLGPDVTERSGKGKFKGKAWGRKGFFFFFGAPQKEASEGLFGREKGRLLRKEAQGFFDF